MDDPGPFLRMLLAAALVVPIGLEREIRGKAAGLRTHVVVGVASAALGYVSLLSAESAAAADQTRIASEVVSGIGFIGAGVIFAARGHVHGLTTAAALWSAAAVGLCVGLGQPLLAMATVAVTVIFLWPVDFLSDRLLERFTYSRRTFQVVADDLEAVSHLQHILGEAGLQATEFTLEPFNDRITIRLIVRCREAGRRDLVSRLRDDPSISFVSDQSLADADA